MSYGTNTLEPYIYKINLVTHQNQGLVSIKSTNIPYKCVGTHGISFSDVNNRIYVECINPTDCVPPYTDVTKCTGSVWGISAETGNVTARLESPYLSAKHGAGFGIQGQPKSSPEEQFILVGNRNNKILAILKPTLKKTEIIEVELKCSPGAITFHAKDPSLVFGYDPNPSNYVAVIALEGDDPTCGVAFLDMNIIVKAFTSEISTLPDGSIEYVDVGSGGGKYRPITSGGGYVITGINPVSQFGPYGGFVLISTKTHTVVQTYKIPKFSKVSFVPIHPESLSYKIKQLSSLQMQTSTNNNLINMAAIVIAIISLLLTTITLVLLSLLYCHFKQKKPLSSNSESVGSTLTKV